VTTPENPPSLISATQLLRCREPQWASLGYQFPMQMPPLTYPRLPVALMHALTVGARTGWHDLVQLSQYQPTGHHGGGWLPATELVVSAIIDVIAKTNMAATTRRRNHCLIADPPSVVNPDFSPTAPSCQWHGNYPADSRARAQRCRACGYVLCRSRRWARMRPAPARVRPRAA
jgi:hypothetical protein